VYRSILNHPRVGFRDKSKGKFLWIHDRRDVNGENFGPIVRWKICECQYAMNVSRVSLHPETKV